MCKLAVSELVVPSDNPLICQDIALWLTFRGTSIANTRAAHTLFGGKRWIGTIPVHRWRWTPSAAKYRRFHSVWVKVLPFQRPARVGHKRRAHLTILQTLPLRPMEPHVALHNARIRAAVRV